MATLTYNAATKQFMLAYSYTNAKGKVKTVAPKPRGLTSLANQIIKAQERGVAAVVGSIGSQDLSALDAVVTLSGSPDAGFSVTIIGYGAECSTHGTAGEALREVVRLSKEYPSKDFRKALRKKQVSVNFMANPAGNSGNSNSQ
jgi:hypothetical protein